MRASITIISFCKPAAKRNSTRNYATQSSANRAMNRIRMRRAIDGNFMRWIWIDKFTEFTSRQSATAIKNVSLAEEHLHNLYPAFPIVPHSLIVEGMAQTAGILVGEARNF